jgi:type I restriction enzyme M protein
VENDGFNLGAQRRPIDKNDLPQVLAEMNEYLRRLRAKESVAAEDFTPTRGLIVAKEKIAANGHFNLSGERYQSAVAGQTRFPMVPLGELVEFIRGITFAKSDQLESSNKNSLLVATTKAAQESGIVEEDLYHIPRSLLKDDNKLLRAGDILISTANSLNLLGRTTHVKRVDRPMSFGAFMSVIRSSDRILDDYLIRLLRTKFAFDFFTRNANTTTNISNLNLGTLATFEIPLPPLEVQKEIDRGLPEGDRRRGRRPRPLPPPHPHQPRLADGPIRRRLCRDQDGAIRDSAPSNRLRLRWSARRQSSRHHRRQDCHRQDQICDCRNER